LLVVSSHSVGVAVGHGVSPVLHASLHEAPAHDGCPPPLVGEGHFVPHPPQLPGSFCSSTQAVGATVGHAE
jgi:hypothetical protein